MADPALRERLLAVIASGGHHAIVFHDIDQVPAGSVGYFTDPSGATAAPSNGLALKDERCWMLGGEPLLPGSDWVFTSNRGPANDRALAEEIERELLPVNGLLVAFDALKETETDTEHGTRTTYADFALTDVLGHGLDDQTLVILQNDIEHDGGLQEHDAYRDLEKQIAQLGEQARERLRALIGDESRLE